MKQQIIGGEYLDIPTEKEMHDLVGHHFNDFTRDFYRGKDYIHQAGSNNAAGALQIGPIGNSGYTWSLKLIAVQVSASATVSVYPGESTNVAPLATPQPTVANGSNNETVFLWTSNVVVLKDQRMLTVLPSAGTITAWRVMALQVPTEMQGKL